MNHLSERTIFPIVAIGVALSWIGTTVAAGQVNITQDRAIAGGISSGDGPGFPILITDPGSYRLDSDLYAADGPYGFFISSPNVTIDFNGFRLYGGAIRPSGNESTDGIIGTQPGVTIKNGTITEFRRFGIFTTADSWTIENMPILSNGIQAGSDAVTCGRYCVVRDSMIADNSGKGVRAGQRSLVERTVVGANCGDGIEMLQGGMVLSNLITLNRCGSAGIRGDADNPNVGYGDNVVTHHSSLPVGVVPLTPNACETADCQ